MKILVTGPSRTGKTTLLRKLAHQRPDAVALIADEVRHRGQRVGFIARLLPGNEQFVIAHVALASTIHVGQYAVDVAQLDAAAQALRSSLPENGSRLVLLDEIGPLQSVSQAFRAVVEDVLGSGLTIVAAADDGEHPWVDAVKARQDVILLQITEPTRDAVLEQVASLVEDRGAASSGRSEAES